MRITADPRALRHVLPPVLASAIRNTGQQDWIDISTGQRPGGVAIIVQDEGNGLLQGSHGNAARERRGIEFRPTLARCLTQARGGRLAVDSMPGIGSRLKLVLPFAA